MLALPDLLISGLDFWLLFHGRHPLLNVRVFAQLHTAVPNACHPRIEVGVHGTVPALEDTLPARLLHLAFQNHVASVGLLGVALDSVVVLLGVVVLEPVDLSLHGPQRGEEERGPLVEVYVRLLGSRGPGAVLVGCVVFAEDVVDAGGRFPGNDVSVGVLYTLLLV